MLLAAQAAKPGDEMDPKIYLLFLLFSAIIISSSHADLREYLRKRHFARFGKTRGAL
jgi:hypothetical protein